MNATPLKFLCMSVFVSACALPQLGSELGLFVSQDDVGAVSRPGTGVYDAAAGTYTIGASGTNMWFKQDAMHFVWKRASGDLSLAADIAFVGTSAQPHRKACLVIRQNLDPGSAYVDVAVHGEGLTALQFRDSQGGVTKEIQSDISAPERVRLDKIGDVVYLSVARAGGKPQPSGASFQLHFTEPFYVGLAVCAHDNTAFETAVFSKVEIGSASPEAAVPQNGLTIVTLPSGDRRVSRVGDDNVVPRSKVGDQNLPHP
jgi:TolB protein